MKTGKTQLILGILLVVLQLLLIVVSALTTGALLGWARGNYGFALLFCLPAILGIWLISLGIRRRKEIEMLMKDPHQIDPWNR